VISTIDNTNIRDPYPQPFEWADTLEAECAEDRLFGLLPCALQCEQSWLPLSDGSYVACSECQLETTP